MSEAPKLFVNKPKKAQLKQSQASASPSPSPSSSAAASMATSTGGSASAPPPQPPKESFARRYKFIWPLLLAVNFSIGAYIFMRTKKKDVGTEEGADATSPVATTAATVAVTETPVIHPPIVEPVKQREPIPEDQQRELSKWLLEEKRKIKPRDREEKKRIDEEKAILKQFIRAKTIPTL